MTPFPEEHIDTSEKEVFFTNQKSEHPPFFLAPNSQGMTFRKLVDDMLDFRKNPPNTFQISKEDFLSQIIDSIEELYEHSYLLHDANLQKLAILFLSYSYANLQFMTGEGKAIGMLRISYQMCNESHKVLDKVISNAKNLLMVLDGDTETRSKLFHLFNHNPKTEEEYDNMKYRIFKFFKESIEEEERKTEFKKLHSDMRERSIATLVKLDDPAYQVNHSFGITPEETVRRERQRRTQDLFPDLKIDFDILERKRLHQERLERATQKLLESIQQLEDPHQMDLFEEEDLKADEKQEGEENGEQIKPPISFRDLGPTEYDIRNQNREEKTSESDRWGFGGNSWKKGKHGEKE